MNDSREAERSEATLRQILTTLEAMRNDIREIAVFVAETRQRRDEAERVQAKVDEARQAQQDRDNKARW